MAGLLDPGLAGSIYASFRGKLLGGVARRPVPASDEDDYGDPAGPPSWRTWKIEGFPEAYSRFTAAQVGIPATDLKLNIFAASAPGYDPQPEDRARLDRKLPGGRVSSQWYQIRGPIETDPARVLHVCQAFEIPEPVQ